MPTYYLNIFFPENYVHEEKLAAGGGRPLPPPEIVNTEVRSCNDFERILKPTISISTFHQTFYSFHNIVVGQFPNFSAPKKSLKNVNLTNSVICIILHN